MTQHIIRTKWHRLLPLIESDDVYLTARKGDLADHWGNHNPSRKDFSGLIEMFAPLPKFVVDSDLLNLVAKENFRKSLMDMKRAGVLRLPFPVMVVEFTMDSSEPKKPVNYICVLRDLQNEERYAWEEHQDFIRWSTEENFPFYGWVFRVHKDEEGEYLVMSPTVIAVDFIEDNDGDVTIKSRAILSGVFDSTPVLEKLVDDTFQKDTGALWYSLASALLIMSTAGVKKEVVQVEKLNKKRVASGKTPIPTHTYIRIGHVYRSADSDEAEEYDARRSPFPHWRRGHLKMVRHGKGRVSLRQVYIKPKLVALKENDLIPPTDRQYRVTP